MSVITDINLDLDIDVVLRRPRIWQNARLKPQVEGLLHELLASVESARLLKPSIVHSSYSVVEIGPDHVLAESNVTLRGTSFHSVLSEAKKLAVVIYTIGPDLENMVTQDFNRTEYLRGLLLDNIGDAALDLLYEEVCQLIKVEAASYGYQGSSPISPGMSGFPISEQRRLFELVPAREIGVSLTSSGMMVPRKSVSMVIGMGPKMPQWSQAEACARCGSGDTCPYRVTA